MIENLDDVIMVTCFFISGTMLGLWIMGRVTK